MEQEEFQPVPREDILRDIRYALSQGFRFRPRKRDHYQEDDFRGWAEAVVAQLELSGTRFVRRARNGFLDASHLTLRPPADEKGV